jgi:hypothetical protein
MPDALRTEYGVPKLSDQEKPLADLNRQAPPR